ncbi:hypothetical protein SVIO_039870 [Streptomyces violaceusniger]|uniref:FG-GAP repeat protein n=1 Tax=Streptomyces violaceusniger TaxID=68280 RepID=A0A4D4KYU8_STRVO|nr:hypothetical protein SVIO_039870 [Streptomyces violaceusniger]
MTGEARPPIRLARCRRAFVRSRSRSRSRRRRGRVRAAARRVQRGRPRGAEAGGGATKGAAGASLGDFNGDGYDDFATAIRPTSTSRGPLPARLAVVYGGPHGLDPRHRLVVNGAEDDYVGPLLRTDLDRDGFTDLVTARFRHGSSPRAERTGETVVLRGGPEGRSRRARSAAARPDSWRWPWGTSTGTARPTCWPRRRTAGATAGVPSACCTGRSEPRRTPPVPPRSAAAPPTGPAVPHPPPPRPGISTATTAPMWC